MLRFLLPLVLMLASVAVALAASSQIVSDTGLYYCPSGKAVQFVIKLTLPREGDYWALYHSQSVVLNNRADGEWLSSYINSVWEKDRLIYNVYVWGKAEGSAAALANRLALQIGTATHQIVPSHYEESLIARIVCAAAETGRNILRVPAYRKWAKFSEKAMNELQPLFNYLDSSERRDGSAAAGVEASTFTAFSPVSAPFARRCRAM